MNDSSLTSKMIKFIKSAKKNAGSPEERDLCIWKQQKEIDDMVFR